MGEWSPYPTVVIVVKDHHTASPRFFMFPSGASRSTLSTASEPNINSPTTDPATYVVSWICGAIRARRPTSIKVATSRSSRSGCTSGSSTAARSSQWVRTNRPRSAERTRRTR